MKSRIFLLGVLSLAITYTALWMMPSVSVFLGDLPQGKRAQVLALVGTVPSLVLLGLMIFWTWSAKMFLRLYPYFFGVAGLVLFMLGVSEMFFGHGYIVGIFSAASDATPHEMLGAKAATCWKALGGYLYLFGFLLVGAWLPMLKACLPPLLTGHVTPNKSMGAMPWLAGLSVFISVALAAVRGLSSPLLAERSSFGLGVAFMVVGILCWVDGALLRYLCEWPASAWQKEKTHSLGSLGLSVPLVVMMLAFYWVMQHTAHSMRVAVVMADTDPWIDGRLFVFYQLGVALAVLALLGTMAWVGRKSPRFAWRWGLGSIAALTVGLLGSLGVAAASGHWQEWSASLWQLAGLLWSTLAAGLTFALVWSGLSAVSPDRRLFVGFLTVFVTSAALGFAYPLSTVAVLKLVQVYPAAELYLNLITAIAAAVLCVSGVLALRKLRPVLA